MKLSLNLVRSTAVLLVVAGSLAACNLGSYDDAVKRFNQNNAPPTGGPPPPPPPPGASFGPNFSEIQAGLFSPTCATANCHTGGAPAANLNLEAANSYANLISIPALQDPGVQLVNPGNPDLSYLITKLEGPGAMGGVMPPVGAIPQADIDVVRQWISDGAIDDTVVVQAPIRVLSLSPAPGAALTAAPTQIVAGFDRDVDAATVNANTFLLRGSGGDGTFSDGNEVDITAASITVPGASPRSAVFDLTGVALADDSYLVSLLGDGASVIMDLDANALDGDGDGNAGGDYFAPFSLTTPVVLGPTLDQIQAVIFGPSCASSTCHGGALPAAGLDLSDADTSHAELVGMPSAFAVGQTLVLPMDPDNSYLIRKMENDAGIIGIVMPPSGSIPQTDIDVIRQWIMDGALR